MRDRMFNTIPRAVGAGVFPGHPGVRVLSSEIHRVLRPGGLATIDVGVRGERRKQVRATFVGAGFQPVRVARSHVLDPYLQYCFRQPPA